MPHHVCPLEKAPHLLHPLRRLAHPACWVLKGLHLKGSTVIDFGCGPGYLTLPIAKRARHVYAIDVQPGMLDLLAKRTAKAKLTTITPSSSLDTLPKDLQVDTVILFYVAHEVPDQQALFKQLFSLLKHGGTLLLAEPQGHVTKQEYEDTLTFARQAGFHLGKKRHFFSSYAHLLKKP